MKNCKIQKQKKKENLFQIFEKYWDQTLSFGWYCKTNLRYDTCLSQKSANKQDFRAGPLNHSDLTLSLTHSLPSLSLP